MFILPNMFDDATDKPGSCCSKLFVWMLFWKMEQFFCLIYYRKKVKLINLSLKFFYVNFDFLTTFPQFRDVASSTLACICRSTFGLVWLKNIKINHMKSEITLIFSNFITRQHILVARAWL